MDDMDELFTFVLPENLCPGNDPLSKSILKDQTTIDLITKSLLKTPSDTYTTDVQNGLVEHGVMRFTFLGSLFNHHYHRFWWKFSKLSTTIFCDALFGTP